jgi:hypothetical protein
MSRRLFEVEAVGSTDAADIAKRRARDEGLRVQTVASIQAVDTPAKTERTRWLVWLAVKP